MKGKKQKGNPFGVCSGGQIRGNIFWMLFRNQQIVMLRDQSPFLSYEMYLL